MKSILAFISCCIENNHLFINHSIFFKLALSAKSRRFLPEVRLRVKFEGRWTREQLINSLCRLMDEMGDDGIEYLTGVNLYFHIEDSEFSAIELVGKNELPIT
ncbi:hypothetical protein BK025_00115 [Sodalis sp. TME1]|nr:hypothetical protein BK025_00115 [Sodalis sp. TME1]